MKTVLSHLLDRASGLANMEPLIALFLGAALLIVFLSALRQARPETGPEESSGFLWTLYHHLLRLVWATFLVACLIGTVSVLRLYLRQTVGNFQHTHGRVTQANYNAVQTIWGAEQQQGELRAEIYNDEEVTERIESEDLTKPAILRKKTVRHFAPGNPFLAAHHEVTLQQSPRKKGSAFYGGYETDCRFSWRLKNPAERAFQCNLIFPLPAAGAIYDGLSATLNGQDVLPQMEIKDASLVFGHDLQPSESMDFRIAFRSRGMSFWYFQVREPREIRDFTLTLHLPDLPQAKLNYPENCMTPSNIQRTPDGEGSILTYRLDHALSNKGMGVALPKIPQPGGATNAVLAETERAWLMIFAMLATSFTLAAARHAVLLTILFGAGTAFAFGLLADFSDLLFGFWGTAIVILIPFLVVLAFLVARASPKPMSRRLAVVLLLFGVIYPCLSGLDPDRRSLYFNLCALTLLVLVAWQLVTVKIQLLGPSLLFLICSCGLGQAAEPKKFDGIYFRGTGDVEYLRLLDTARRMFAPDPEFQNLAMLYMPAWNGLVEGPTWDAWWIQNSYGPTYSVLPFLQEPFVTFLQNSHDLWLDQMGDGQRVGAAPPFDWVAPDGCLCDAARPGWVVYKQGDGRTHLHDWGMEFTAAGLLMQSELLLIGRDLQVIQRYLPKLERCANFIETRRDPTNNLFLAGPAGNLLAPSYAGWKKPDGTYGRAYLTGLSVTYIAALDRLIALEKLAGRDAQAQQQTQQRDAAKQGLAQLATDEGYFIRSLDPDSTRHGVFGADQHGYFESSPNHDAIAFRVVDDAQAERIYAKIASIPGLRPHQFILPNYPSYDDLYEKPEGLWAFGTWVNGGHWSTCEARMMLGYYRLGRFEDARRSMLQLLTFAKRFRMDNPLVKFGSEVYQPGLPINLTYDAFGPPAAFIRGLFEYLYRADGLTLIPHIPPGITRLEQRFPIRFGTKRLYLASVGQGPIAAVRLNGQLWRQFDAQSVFLPYDQVPAMARIEIALGGTDSLGSPEPLPEDLPLSVPPHDTTWLRFKKTNLATNALPLRLGADSHGGSCFKGDLARARVFSRALTKGELATSFRGDTGSLLNDPSLLGDWSFDNLADGAFVSKHGLKLPAKIVGTAQVVDTPRGKAIRLDGSGYLEIAAHPALNLTEACTLEAWIRPDTLPHGGGRIIDKSEVGTSNGYLLDTYPGHSLRLIAQIGTLDHAAKLSPGQWVHVAGTVASNGTLTLFLQGEPVAQRPGSTMPDIETLLATARRLQTFHRHLTDRGLADSYEAAHARLALQCLSVTHTRLAMLNQGKLQPLSNPVSQAAADESYLETTRKHVDGLVQVLANYEKSGDPKKRPVLDLWKQSAEPSSAKDPGIK